MNNTTDVLKTIQKVLDEKEEEIRRLKDQLGRLSEDFQFNLNLIDQRDAEIEKSDGIIQSLQHLLNNKTSECAALQSQVSESSIQIQELSRKLDSLQKNSAEQITKLQADLRAEQEEHHSSLRIATEDFETEKRALNRKLLQSEEAMESLRQKMLLGTEDAIRKIRIETDAKATSLEDENLVLKSANRNNEQKLVLAAQENEKLVAEVEHLKELLSLSEKEQQRQKWEIDDLSAQHKTQIAMLEQQKEALTGELRRTQRNLEQSEARCEALNSQQIPQLQQTADELRVERDALQRAGEQLQAEVEALHNQLADGAVAAQAGEQKRAGLERDTRAATAEAAQLRAHIASMDKECAARDATIRQQRAELDIAAQNAESQRERLQEQKQKLRRLRDVPAAVRILMEEHAAGVAALWQEVRALRVDAAQAEHEAALQQSEHEAAEAASAERVASLEAQLTQND